MSTRKAAASLGFTYNKLMGMIYAGKVKAEKCGWCWFVHVDEVEAVRQRSS